MTPTFAHDGLALSVDAPDDDLRWLEEFTDPSFARVPAGEPLVCLSFEQVSGTGPVGEPTGGRVAFTLDSGAIRLPESRIGGGVRLHDARCGVAIDITAEGRDTGIRYGGSRSRARIRLMRVVREYAHNNSVSSGGLMLHAAGLTIGGVALAIAGSKGAGKTTLALRMLALPGVGYLSNDRVLVRAQPEPRAIAVPTVVAVRAGTRALMPEITARLQHVGDFREHAGEREARGASAPVTDGDAWHVSPHQLCTAFDRPLAATAPLAAVLFPMSDRTGARQLRRLDASEAADALEESLLGRGSGQYVSDVFIASSCPAPDESSIGSTCLTLASRVPCFATAVPDDVTVAGLTRLLDDCLAG